MGYKGRRFYNDGSEGQVWRPVPDKARTQRLQDGGHRLLDGEDGRLGGGQTQAPAAGFG